MKNIILFKLDQENIQTLPLKLSKNGFEYTQVLKSKRSCIYEQRVCEGSIYYEVFRIRVKPRRKIVIKGELMREVNAQEIFPSNESFGNWAWTYRLYEKALLKFKELENGSSCTRKNN